MGITAKVKGTQKLIADLRAISSEADKLSNAIVGVAADKITTKQKQAAPADLGKIRQGLGNAKAGPSLYTIFSNAPESPYQEFGTGKQVVVGDKWADIAAQFKGKGTGDWASFIRALIDWVKRKGINPVGTYQVSTRQRISRKAKKDIDESTAIMIARAILSRGLKPQPFFFHNIEIGFKDMEKMLKTGLEQMHNKYKKL